LPGYLKTTDLSPSPSKWPHQMSEGTRRLAAIMFTDIVGYTALSQRNEKLALQLLGIHRSVMRPIIAKHKGHEVKTIGDAFMVQFESALEAVECAVEMQEATHNQVDSSSEKFEMKIGVHVGDVVQSDSDVHGDAVNIASRIEPLAKGGEICISQQVYDQVRNKVPFKFVKLELHELKNVAMPIDVYRVELPWGEDTTPPRATGYDKNRVAVLPFTNMSSDQEEGYFADGMTEELITSLSGVRQLTVIARTSIMGYKSTTKKVKEIGSELEVGSILEGSVRKAGDRVRITAQLIDTATEGHLWAKNYDRTLEDVFAIQSEIAEMVAGELKIRLVEDEKRVIEKRPTERTEAYVFYLKGRELIRERTELSLRRALGVFEKAIELDPSFAKAYSGLAETHMTLSNDDYESDEQATPKAELNVKKALQLDPELAEAHAVLATVYFLEDKVGLSEVEAKRAIELNPSLPDAYFTMSSVAFLRRNVDEGIKAVEASYRLDPLVPFHAERLGFWYVCFGREDDAFRHWEKTSQIAPAGTYRAMTEYYLGKGDFQKAKESYSKARTLDPSNRWATWMDGFIAGATGDREGALRTIKEIEARWLGVTNLNDLAFIYYALGDLDSFFTYIDRATDQHTLQYRYVMYSPLFARARIDPRYQAFLDKMGRIAAAS
jgi:adenylate cyclase